MNGKQDTEVVADSVCALDLECHKVKIGMLVDLIFILLAEGNINRFNRMIRKKGNDFK